MGLANKPALIACFQSGRYGHRIRHYGLFANTGRAANIARLRELLGSMPPPAEASASPSQDEPAETVLPPCPCCGGRMIVIEFLEPGMQPRYRAPSVGRHPDRHVMSWNHLLDCRVLPRLIACSQVSTPALCPRRLPSAKVTAKPLLPKLSSPAIPPTIPRKKLPRSSKSACTS